MTSVEGIAPKRMAAAVCNADHCQTGPLGGCALADFRGTALFFCAFAPALMRPVDLIVDFPGSAFFKPFFRLTTVFFAISRLVALAGTLEAPGSQVETGERLLTLNVGERSFIWHAIGCAVLHRWLNVSVSQHSQCSCIKSALLTSHSRKLGSVFEGRPGRTDNRFDAIIEWGWKHERQRTRQANTGANAKQEANRDNEAKSAQAKSRKTIKSRIPGQAPG